MRIVERINDEIKAAMKSRSELRLSVLRMLKSKLLLVNARGDIADPEAMAIVRSYAKTLRETLQMAKDHAKTDLVAATEAEIVITNEFLPAALDAAAIEKIVTEVIAAIGKDKALFGKIMKESLARCNGQADGAAVKPVVDRLLA